MFVTLPDDAAFDNAIPVPVNGSAGPAATRLRPGDGLFYEGDEVEWLYQVTSGVLRLTRLLANGRRQVIAFGYPGDVVGFPACGLHHTDCDALTEVRLRPFRRSVLESGAGDSALHEALLQSALREISAMQDHLMVLGRKSATEKLASFLHALARRVGEDCGGMRRVHLPMSRADIADFLGLTTETVSRTLTLLRKQEIIAIDNIHTVIIRDPAALLAQTESEQA